jgi:hypothetical protein
MKTLPSIEPKKLIWPEPEPRTFLDIANEGLKTLFVVLVLLLLVSLEQMYELECELEDAKLAAHHADGRTARLMNGHGLTDSEGHMYIPADKVVVARIER